MRKTFFTLLFLAILSLIITVPVMAADEAEAPEYYATKWTGGEFFFANGTPITIEADPDNTNGAIIKWEGGSQKITDGSKAYIFGGMHNNDTKEVNTSITMNGGTVRQIYGGGFHKSKTNTSEVVMNGGTALAIYGGGADSLNFTGCEGCTQSESTNFENSKCQTKTANVTITNGTVTHSVWGGGNGYSNTESATVTISGGDFQYVTGGGSNGNTSNVNIIVTGGAIDILQSVNRGTAEEVTVIVAGGTIDNLYAGGESPAPAGDVVNATITSKLHIAVAGVANVKEMSLGSNGKSDLVVSDDPDAVLTTEDIVIVEGTVEKNNIPEEDMIVAHHVVIDDELYLVKTGDTVKDIEGEKTYSDITKKEGYNFVGFQTEEGKTWGIDTKIEEDIVLKTVFEKIEEDKDKDEVKNEVKEEKDDTPKTGVESIALPVFATVAVISLAGIVVNRKRK